jgi:hypothetical protein
MAKVLTVGGVELTWDGDGVWEGSLELGGAPVPVRVFTQDPAPAVLDDVGRFLPLAPAAYDAAWATIQAADDEEVALYAAHHLDELPLRKLETKLGGIGPFTPAQLLAGLRLQALTLWPDDDEALATFDFGLGKLSQYLLAVRCDRAGGVVSVDMES